ncbi:MAG TPA: HAMP domain-containing sensor histidine kinase [Candidatus Sulfotelmatobacter sp.]
MRVLKGHYWYAAAGGITAIFAAVSFAAHQSSSLTAFADFFGLLLLTCTTGIMLTNAFHRPGTERTFWALMAFGFALWAFNQGAWTYCEAIRHVEVPDPYFADIILFFHIVPMIAAAGWRPDEVRTEPSFHLSTVNFLMLLVWWIFLYAFVIVPHQFVVLNVLAYDKAYIPLYGVENVLLLTALSFAAFRSKGAWKKVYLNFLAAGALYSAGSKLLDQAVTTHAYYSGSLYDIPLIFAVAWMAATALAARHWDLKRDIQSQNSKHKPVMPQLAMLALLSLPCLGLWSFFADRSVAASRVFRLFAVLCTMLILGVFVFLRQYLQDQTLIGLLEESRDGYENQQRLQNQLVQKEKLASLGQLVAGAASEINPPLATVMEYSEQLWSQQRLSPEQGAIVRKIVNQAQRTSELVFDLLSFAQQAPGGKALVDVGQLLQRGAQMLEARHAASQVRIEVSIESDFPQVLGNANQLFQAFVEIIENSIDALEVHGGGSLKIMAHREGHEAVLQFLDSGPGIQEPQRVFDPFYTTKPVGKGTGLGLSAVYGVVQDHEGQITCQNNPAGGALFTIRFPLSTAIPAAAAAKA